jgi:hypothetical protein
MHLRFTITETMTGLHHFVDPALGDPADRRFYFRIVWGGRPTKVLNPLSPDFLFYDADGVVFAEGLGPDEIPCKGTLRLDYFGTRKITYTLHFDHGGHSYRYVGAKVNVDLRNPLMLVKTHTTCYGEVTDETGKVVSKSVLHFEPESMAAFLTSVRVSLE